MTLRNTTLGSPRSPQPWRPDADPQGPRQQGSSVCPHGPAQATPRATHTGPRPAHPHTSPLHSLSHRHGSGLQAHGAALGSRPSSQHSPTLSPRQQNPCPREAQQTRGAGGRGDSPLWLGPSTSEALPALICLFKNKLYHLSTWDLIPLKQKELLPVKRSRTTQQRPGRRVTRAGGRGCTPGNITCSCPPAGAD